MAYEIREEIVAARPLAAVHASVRVGDVATAWRPALDEVWAFLGRHDGLRTDGHNIFVYHHPVQPGARLEVDFGVEVSRPFTVEGEIVSTHTPAGRVASTVHIGSPAELGKANAAIEAWCTANQRPHAGVSWEIYGDPGDDPNVHEVKVCYLLGS